MENKYESGDVDMKMRILRGVKKVNSGLTVPQSSHHLKMCFCFYKKNLKI